MSILVTTLLLGLRNATPSLSKFINGRHLFMGEEQRMYDMGATLYSDESDWRLDSRQTLIPKVLS
jgi:hypothetical protein